MQRIVHVISGLAVGGAEMALYRLITHSRSEHRSHIVISLTPEGAMRQRFQEAGIELHLMDFRNAPVAEFLRLVSLMRSLHPDVVQTWMYHADLFGGLAARLAGNRTVIWSVHSTHLSDGTARMTRIVQRLCAWISGFVPSAVICVAEASRRMCIEVGYEADRLVVVPNGFDLSRLLASEEQAGLLRRQCGFTENDVVTGSVGRFSADKDQRNFVKAAGLLAAHNPRARFLMLGKGVDSANAQLSGWIAESGYPERFVLLGERVDVPVCMAAMDIFCLHSRTEAFPLAAGEAMAMGVPCVVTDVGDAAALVADTGVVVPRADANALAQGLARLADMSGEVRRRMGRRARARIEAEFTIEHARARVEALYAGMARQARH